MNINIKLRCFSKAAEKENFKVFCFFDFCFKLGKNVWLRNRLISDGLELVLCYTEKS